MVMVLWYMVMVKTMVLAMGEWSSCVLANKVHGADRKSLVMVTAGV
jgi:hypothetical protein